MLVWVCDFPTAPVTVGANMESRKRSMRSVPVWRPLRRYSVWINAPISFSSGPTMLRGREVGQQRISLRS